MFGTRAAIVSGGAPQGPWNDPASKVWLRADLGITLGTGVAAWANQRDTNLIAAVAQATGSQQPTVNPNAINGQPALVFDSSASQCMRNPFSATLAQPLTTFVVAKVAALTGGAQFLWDNYTGGDRQAVFTSTNAFPLTINGDAGTTINDAAQVAQNAWHVFELFADGASTELCIDGVVVATGDAGANGLGGLTIGAQNGASVLFLNGSIAELVVGCTSRSVTRQYLGARYGITVI